MDHAPPPKRPTGVGGSLTDRAELLMDAGRPREALAVLAPDLAGDDPHLWYLVTHCRLRLEDFPAALAAADRLNELAPHSPWGPLYRSEALVGMARFREAVTAADEAVHRAPALADAHAQWAFAASQLDSLRGRKAPAAARKAVELAPDDAAVHVLAGAVALRADRYLLARRHYREALRLDPDNAAAHYGLSLLSTHLGRLVGGDRLLGRAVLADPAGDWAVDGTAALLSRWLLAISLALLGTTMLVLVHLDGAAWAGPACLVLWAVVVGWSVHLLVQTRGRPARMFGAVVRRRWFLGAWSLALMAWAASVVRLVLPGTSSSAFLDTVAILVLGGILTCAVHVVDERRLRLATR